MSARPFSQIQKLRVGLKSANTTAGEIVNKIKNYETPERIKGTILERWAKYWKNLYLDYKEVAIDVAKECKERPIKASIYTTLLATGYFFCKHNPDECSFREDLLQNNIKLMQVGEPVRNPISAHHTKWIGQCYDEGIVRRLNLGLMSLIWLDDYDKACSLYKATCPYLKPRYLTFYERVVDVGFLDTWWVLENMMKDYDINEAEFVNVE